MAGTGPTIVATITAKDEASAAIQKLTAMAKAASENSAKLTGRASKDATEAMQRMSLHGNAVASQMSTRMSALSAEMAAGMAAFGTSAIHSILAVGGEMERIQRRMASFTNTTSEQMAKLRRDADITFSGVKGGPQGFFEGARAASMSGVKPDAAGIVSKYGAVFADETGEDNAHATEQLVQHTAMLGHLKDDSGKAISFAEATSAQVERAMKETMNLLIAINKIAPGNIGQVYEGFKFAGPTALGLGRDANETAALYTVLAEHGIAGAEAGNTIKSAESRLLSPVAKARQAIATGGLNYGDYVKANPDVATVEGIEKGVSLRLGTLNAATKHGIEQAVAKFKAGGGIDEFNVALTDTFIKSGVKSVQDRLKASNLARDVSQNFASTADLPAFLRDAFNKGLGVGFLNAVFGKEQGGRLAAVSGQEVLDKKKLYDDETLKDNVGEAMRERERSYDGRLSAMEGAFTGLKDRLFQPAEPALGGAYHVAAEMMKAVSSLPGSVREWIDGLIVAGTVLGTVKTASTLTKITQGLLGMAPAAEGAATALGLAAETFGRFSMIGAGITGFSLGNALGEGANELGAIAAGKYFTPADDDAAADLRQQRDEAQRQLDQMRKNAFDYAGHDSTLADYRRQLADLDRPDGNEEARRLLTVDRTKLLQIDPSANDPTVKGLNDQLAATVAKINIAMAPIDMDSFSNESSRLLDRIAEHPNASDPARLEAEKALATLRGKLDAQAAAVRDLAVNQAKAEQLQADIAAQRAKNEKARADAIAADDAKLQTLDPAGRVAERERLSGLIKAREQDDAAQSVNPAEANLRDTIANLDNRIRSYEVSQRAPYVGNPFLASSLEAFGIRQGQDDLRPGGEAIPRTGFPSIPGARRPRFGLDGPEYEGLPSFHSSDASAAGATKIDVNGTISGKAELFTTSQIEVMPSPYFLATVKRAEAVSNIGLSGSLGHDMTGSNAPVHVSEGLGPH